MSGMSLTEVAYVTLRDRIIQLDLKPGSVLIEEQLMTELEMGRTPIREAVKRLAQEGFIVILPRRGTLVSEITASHPSQVGEVRVWIETLCGRLAAQRRTPADLEKFDDYRSRLASLDSNSSGEELLHLDASIHRDIHRMTYNPLLHDTADQYFNLALRIWYSVGARAPGQAYVLHEVQKHDELLRAIEDGDAELAGELAAAHVVDTAARLATVDHGFGTSSAPPGPTLKPSTTQHGSEQYERSS